VLESSPHPHQIAERNGAYAEEVLDEWRRIAEVFPFLRLTCQLYSETCEENTSPLVEYVVAEGRASARPGVNMLARSSLGVSVRYARASPRGCTLDLLEKAVAAARAHVLHIKDGKDEIRSKSAT
jgi:hypothetical protein